MSKLFIPTVSSTLVAVMKAADAIRQNFRDPTNAMQIKADGSPVTSVDMQIHQELLAWSIAQNIGYIGEEGNGDTHNDVILYVEWLVARDTGALETAEDVFPLFRPEMQQQLLETEIDRAGVPVVPPFDDPDYDVVKMRSQARDLESESRDQNAKSRDASRNAARYGGLGVMFAAVLAAVGISGQFHHKRSRRILSSLAGGLLLVGLLYMAFSPISTTAF